MKTVAGRFVTSRLLMIACVSALFYSAWPAAQTPPAQKPKSTGLILGRVVEGLSTRPVAGATVTIASRGVAPGVQFQPQQAITGGDGYFLFHDLPKAEFVLLTSALGFLTSDGAGVNHPGGSSQRVTLGEGERLNDVLVRLWRTAVVTGQLTDEHGEAVEGITVSLLKANTTGGRRRLVSYMSASTDDRGVYRFASLVPGDYALCALFTRHLGVLSSAMDSSLEAQRYASGSGAPSNSGSGYRVGDLMLISGSGSRNVDPAPDESGNQLVFADACAPGAAPVTSAEPFTVGSGEIKAGVDLLLHLVPAAKIFGIVTSPSGPVPGMGVHLLPAEVNDLGLGAGIESSATLTTADGRFGFISVPAGSYVLKVMYVPPDTDGRAGLARRRGGPVDAAAPDAPVLWASSPITVGSADINGVALSLREGTRLSGRVVFDGASARPKEPLSGVEATCASFDSGPSGRDLPEVIGRVRADDAFVISGLAPGMYRCGVTGGFPAPWTFKSLLVQSRDVTVESFEVGGTDITGVQLVLTDQASTLSGLVHTTAGAADPNAMVVVFPQNRARWVDAGGPSRQEVSARTSRSGTFQLSNLPAGDYFAIAVDDRLNLRWQDPTVLNQLAPDAARLTISDGDKHTLSLTTSRIR